MLQISRSHSRVRECASECSARSRECQVHRSTQPPSPSPRDRSRRCSRSQRTWLRRGSRGRRRTSPRRLFRSSTWRPAAPRSAGRRRGCSTGTRPSTCTAGRGRGGGVRGSGARTCPCRGMHGSGSHGGEGLSARPPSSHALVADSPTWYVLPAWRAKSAKATSSRGKYTLPSTTRARDEFARSVPR